MRRSRRLSCSWVFELQICGQISCGTVVKASRSSRARARVLGCGRQLGFQRGDDAAELGVHFDAVRLANLPGAELDCVVPNNRERALVFLPAFADHYCRHCGFLFREEDQDRQYCREYALSADHGRCEQRLRDSLGPNGLQIRLRKTLEADPYSPRTSPDAVAHAWVRRYYPDVNLQEWQPREDPERPEDHRASVPLPGLTSSVVGQLATEWDDGGLWEDIERLASRLWGATDAGERLLRWHHLVLAAGNFKRQPGRRLRPAVLKGLDNPVALERGSEITLPTGSGSQAVSATEAETWRSLMGALPGARVATTTTLLTALWPDKHFIFDRRVHWAANGLRICSGLQPSSCIDVGSSHWREITLDDYVVVREWVLEMARLLEVSPSMIERSLYILDRHVPSFEGETWTDYADRICKYLAQRAV